jgi:hypothetical protein
MVDSTVLRLWMAGIAFARATVPVGLTAHAALAYAEASC